MPYGFQCFDPDTGLQIFDVTDRLTKVLGIINPTGAANFSGVTTLTADQLVGGNIFIYPMRSIVYDIDNERLSSNMIFNSGVAVSQSDGTITCNKINYPVMYGVW